MIKITIKNKEITEKEVEGNASEIITDLACLVDSVLEVAVIATKGLETKEKLLKIMSVSLEKWWKHEKCSKCGEELDWDNKDEYIGKIKWN